MLDDLIPKLKKYRLEEISYKTGLSITTLTRLINGKNDNPTLKTIQTLQQFLTEKENELSS